MNADDARRRADDARRRQEDRERAESLVRIEEDKPCTELAIAEREARALERIAAALEQLVETGSDIVGAIHGAAETLETESQNARGLERHD